MSDHYAEKRVQELPIASAALPHQPGLRLRLRPPWTGAAAPLREGDASARVCRRERVNHLALAFADITAAVLALVAVCMVSNATSPWLVGLSMPVIVATNQIAGLYARDDLLLNRTTLDEAPQLFQVSGLFALVVSILHEPMAGAALRPEHILMLWLGSTALILVARRMARPVAGRLTGPQRCLVVGELASLDTVRRKLQQGCPSAEVVADVAVSTAVHSSDVVAAVRDALRGDRIDRVIVAPHSSDAGEMLEVIRVAKLEGVRVTVLPRLFEVVGSSVEFDEVDGLVMLGVRRFGLSRSSAFVKRSFDLVGATAGLLAVLPLMALIAVAVRLESRGPVLFRQTRVGRDGKEFEILKFRSMVVQADAQKADLLHLNESHGIFKMTHDPRVTRVGRLLRRTSLDELPQLLNVWRGEMSLVGPRPLVLDEDAMVVGLDRARLHLTPGMTGPWQVLGATRAPMREMVVIDYLYAANWSLWTDVKILLRTVEHILAGRGH